MPGFERITFDPNVMGGQACIRGMRIPVSVILNLLANGMLKDEIIAEYPDLEKEDIQEALGWAGKKLGVKSEIEKRLSSPNLYHYTKCVSTLKIILCEGFRFKLDNEKLPFKDLAQRSFRICFCDIPLNMTVVHRIKYGNYAIGLKKDWGIKKSISPITYLHENSLPSSVEYQKFKALHHGLMGLLDQTPSQHLGYSTLLWSLCIDAGFLLPGTFEESVKSNSAIYQDRIQADDLRLKRFMNYLKESDFCIDEFESYLRSLAIRLHEIYSHVGLRDLMTRIYEENVNNENKINYDEREWRAIANPNSFEFLEKLKNFKDKDLSTPPLPIEEQEDIIRAEKAYIEKCYSQAYLPVEHNLTFSNDDIVAILVEDEKSVEEIKKFIRTEQTLLNYEAVKDKIKTIDGFSE